MDVIEASLGTRETIVRAFDSKPCTEPGEGALEHRTIKRTHIRQL
jgi:hypothetical protein